MNGGSSGSSGYIAGGENNGGSADGVLDSMIVSDPRPQSVPEGVTGSVIGSNGDSDNGSGGGSGIGGGDGDGAGGGGNSGREGSSNGSDDGDADNGGGDGRGNGSGGGGGDGDGDGGVRRSGRRCIHNIRRFSGDLINGSPPPLPATGSAGRPSQPCRYVRVQQRAPTPARRARRRARRKYVCGDTMGWEDPCESCVLRG